MDQGLGEESHAESSSTPHPQPHELEEVADVNEHERLLPQTNHENGPETPTVAPQPEPHGSGAGVHDKISGVNESRGAGGSAFDESQAHRELELPEDLATVRISKLQQLVELCAQILRESRGAKPNDPDIEKDGEGGTSAPTSKFASSSDDTQNIFHLDRSHLHRLPSTYETNRLAIEEIWNNVSPWPIQQAPLASSEELQSHPIFTLSTPEALHPLLFTVSSGSNPERTKVEACIPSFRIKSPYQRNAEEERKKILVIACCCEIADENPQIGSILECCYKYGVLEQPIDKESRAYLDQICLLVECWSRLNRVSKISLIFDSPFGEEEFFYSSSYRLKTIFTRRKSVEEILGIGFVDLLRILHLLNPVLAPLDSSPGPTLRVDDLDILSLSTLGKLSINWTSILENHLCLDLEEMTLSIAWSFLPRGEFMTMQALQDSVINRIPMSFIGGDMKDRRRINRFVLDKEVAQSWAFLFVTSRNSKTRSQNYDEFLESSVPKWLDDTSPKWLRSLHLGTLIEGDEGDEDNDDDVYFYVLTYNYRRVLGAALNKDPVSYAQFPVFETRLRQLQHYMGSQKPRGLRQLWKDNRDSLNYYTFWGVIVFGLLSVFLAFFSLAVSVAQTVASFRALELATPPASTS